jgi:hypothetical protein
LVNTRVLGRTTDSERKSTIVEAPVSVAGLPPRSTCYREIEWTDPWRCDDRRVLNTYFRLSSSGTVKLIENHVGKCMASRAAMIQVMPDQQQPNQG